jgi:hypothetical protein
MFAQPLQVGGSLAAAFLIAYSIHVVTRAQELRQYSDIHGSARWAKLSDIKKAGLLQPEGVYVGEWKNGSKIYTLRHNGPEHVLCYAPPRSGKGVGLVLPTMLTLPHFKDPELARRARMAGRSAEAKKTPTLANAKNAGERNVFARHSPLNRQRRIVSEDEKVRPLQFSKTERPTFTIEKLNLEDIRPEYLDNRANLSGNKLTRWLVFQQCHHIEKLGRYVLHNGSHIT